MTKEQLTDGQTFHTHLLIYILYISTYFFPILFFQMIGQLLLIHMLLALPSTTAEESTLYKCRQLPDTNLDFLDQDLNSLKNAFNKFNKVDVQDFQIIGNYYTYKFPIATNYDEIMRACLRRQSYPIEVTDETLPIIEELLNDDEHKIFVFAKPLRASNTFLYPSGIQVPEMINNELSNLPNPLEADNCVTFDKSTKKFGQTPCTDDLYGICALPANLAQNYITTELKEKYFNYIDIITIEESISFLETNLTALLDKAMPFVGNCKPSTKTLAQRLELDPVIKPAMTLNTISHNLPILTSQLYRITYILQDIVKNRQSFQFAVDGSDTTCYCRFKPGSRIVDLQSNSRDEEKEDNSFYTFTLIDLILASCTVIATIIAIIAMVKQCIRKSPKNSPSVRFSEVKTEIEASPPSSDGESPLPVRRSKI